MKILSWNIRSINGKVDDINTNKLNDVQIKNMLTFYDLIFLQETHLDKKAVDDISLPGYVSMHYCRTKRNKTFSNSGGISVFIKESHRKCIKFLPQSNSDIVWIQIVSQNAIRSPNHEIFIGCVYIPPEFSSFGKQYTRKIWDSLEQDIEVLSQRGQIVLCGDFNARSGRLTDFIEMDSHPKYYKLPEKYAYDNFYHRCTMDSVVQKNGRILVNMCTDNQLYILNGRTLGDLQGRFTCFQPQGCSVVDYFVCSQSLMKKVNYMKVKDLMAHSDHCPVGLNIHIASIDDVSLQKPYISKRNTRVDFDTKIPPEQIQPHFVWDKNSRERFQKALELPVIQSHIKQIKCQTKKISEQIKQNTKQSDSLDFHSTINECSKQMSDVFMKAAQLSLKAKRSKPLMKMKHSKKWFDSDCVKMRKEVKSLLNAINRNPYKTELRQKYFSQRKQYNKMIKRKKNVFKNALVSKLHDVIEEDPSALWKTLRKLKDSEDDGIKHLNPMNNSRWTEHLRKLIGDEPQVNPDRREQVQNMFTGLTVTDNPLLDKRITMEEITRTIKRLKNNKSPGKDGITNEMIKSISPSLMEAMQHIFNIVLDTGIYPYDWKVGLNIPIYKNGCTFNPENYRGITLTNTIGKLFCQVLNQRISDYLEENNCLVREQAGFRKTFRTTDHIFLLNKLVDSVLKTRTKRLYCCFVDFQKAFDNVWHQALLVKLNKIGITGKIFNIVKNMYLSATVSTKIKGRYMDEITVKKGVHQGNTLSPTLFNVYINDIVQYVKEKDSPFITATERIPCLLYADDLALLSTTKLGLQTKLDRLQKYCSDWGLKINKAKTKVIVFTNSLPKIPIYFNCGDHMIETVKTYKYLGVVFHQKGKFQETQEYLAKQSTKAAYAIRKAVHGQSLKPDIIMRFFDSLITPILTYGAEIWFPFCFNGQTAFHIDDLFKSCLSGTLPYENLHVKFCKQILGVHKKAMVLPTLGELGRFPLTFKIISQLISFWIHVTDSKPDSYNRLLYDYLYQNDEQDRWINTIKNILCTIGFKHIWKNQSTLDINRLTYAVQRKLEDLYKTFWVYKKQEFTKLRFYDFVTKEYRLEPYLINCKNKNYRKTFCKFRTSCHDLMIEKGRHKKIPRENRICKYCKQVEDEYHLLDECLLYDDMRNNLLLNIKSGGNGSKQNTDKLSKIVTCDKYQMVIIKYVYDCFEKRQKIK